MRRRSPARSWRQIPTGCCGVPIGRIPGAVGLRERARPRRTRPPHWRAAYHGYVDELDEGGPVAARRLLEGAPINEIAQITPGAVRQLRRNAGGLGGG